MPLQDWVAGQLRLEAALVVDDSVDLLLGPHGFRRTAEVLLRDCDFDVWYETTYVVYSVGANWPYVGASVVSWAGR